MTDTILARRRRLRSEGRHHLGGHPRLLSRGGRRLRLRALLQLRAPGRGAAGRPHRRRVEHAARPRARAAAHRGAFAARSACATPTATSAPRSSCAATPASRDSPMLAGKTLAVGSRDSTQARILPLHFLPRRGRRARAACGCCRSTPTSASTATPARASSTCWRALADGRAQAGRRRRSGLGRRAGGGAGRSALVEVLWTTPRVRPLHVRRAADAGRERRRRPSSAALFAMRWENPAHRRLLELEGLRQWMPPREEGYDSLRRALDESEGW